VDAILRLFRFRAAHPGFDEVLRTTLIPDLKGQPGLFAAYSGRQGPAEIGPRIVASVWETRDAMEATVGADLGTFHPELLADSTERSLEILPLVLARRFDVGEEARILRVLRGSVRPGELELNVEDARAGTELDGTGEHGPCALFLAQAEDDTFVTMSAWREWHDIELATGGDIHRPRATRHDERLVEWEVEHFEIVPSA
jgi:hypothetical protein